MLRSLRLRLIASYVTLTLLTVALMGVLALTLVRRYTSERETRALTSSASVIAEQVAPLLAQPDVRRLAVQDMAVTASLMGDARVRILDARRDPIADSGIPEKNIVSVAVARRELPAEPGAEATPFLVALRSATAPQDQPAQAGQLVPATFAYRHTGTLDAPRSDRVIAVPVVAKGLALGFVEMSAAPDLVASAVATTQRAIAMAGAGATVLAALAGLFVSRGLSAPILGLAGAAERMGAGDLDARAPVAGSGETALLARQFNEMAGRLQTSFNELAAERDALRRFIADASHELRTPITALKTFNELLAAGAVEERAVRKEFLEESAAQLARLERLTHELLDLSRLDAGLAALDVRPESTAELVAEAGASFRAVAAARGATLEADPPAEDAIVPCDRRRIESALCNLLDNALQHTPSGGTVTLDALATEEAVRFRVTDTGAGISDEDLPHVFERFYRGKQADAAYQGTGLGLAIVQSVAQADGGAVTVESRPGEGSAFTLELPR